MGESYAFYVVVFIGMFLVYYLKAYKQIVFATAFMFEFTAIFSLIKRDFLALMVDRLLDVAAGFVIVFVTYLLTRKNDYTTIKDSLSSALMCFRNLVQISLNESNKDAFSTDEKGVLGSLNELNNAIKVSKNLDNDSMKNAKFIASKLDDINSDLVKLRNYLNLDELKEKKTLQNDVKIISDRFLMLDKKIKKLPYYFISDIEAKLLCKDENAKKLILRVTLGQNEIYSALSF